MASTYKVKEFKYLFQKKKRKKIENRHTAIGGGG